MKLVFFFTLLTCHYCDGQEPALPNDVIQYIKRHCVLCVKSSPAASDFISFVNHKDTEAYHTCHTYFEKGAEDSAYKYSLFVLSKLQNARDYGRFVGATLINARILYHKGLLQQALEKYLSLQKAQKLDSIIKGYLAATIGSTYLEREHHHQALPYLLDAVHKFGIKDSRLLMVACNNIAVCYLAEDKKEQAELYFDKSLALAKRAADTIGLAYLYTNIANQYYNRYEDRVAIRYFKKALDYALTTRDFNIRQLAYLNMSVIEENLKHYTQAIIYRKSYEEQHDSLYNRDHVWTMAKIENRLDSQRNAYKVQMVQQANQAQHLQLKEQETQLYLSMLLAALLLSFLLFALYAYRRKNAQNRVIIAQREELDALNRTKDQLFSIVAHDLRSPVQTLRAMLVNLKTALSDQDIHLAAKVSLDVESIANSTHSLLNNLLYWALSHTQQLYFTSDKLNLYRLAEQVYYDYTPVAASRNISLCNQVPKHIHCMGDLNSIKIILRNLVDNAIKFSDPDSSVTTSAISNGNECILSVADEGPGMHHSILESLADKAYKNIKNAPGGSRSTGLGLWLIKTMTEKNAGTVSVENKLRGTAIHIHLPNVAP